MGLAVRRRIRLSSQARRDRLLDAALRVILARGLDAMSMEGLAREEGVSKGLVYAYFPNRDALLAALVQREQAAFRADAMERAARAADFEGLIQATTRAYLEHCRDRGALITLLMNDPALDRVIAAADLAQREATVAYFVRRASAAFHLERPVAEAAVDMLMAVTGRAGAQVAAGTLAIDQAESIALSLIFGGLQRLAGGAAARPDAIP